MQIHDASAPFFSWAARVGAAAFILVGAAWLFAGPLELVLQSPLVSAVDQHVAAWVHARAVESTISMLSLVSRMHGTLGILSMSVLAAAVLSQWGRRNAWPCLLVAVPGGLLLNFAIKLAIRRTRPEWDYAAETLASFSFPSGHTLGATVFYAFILVLAWPATKGWSRWALVAASAAMVALVAASRIVLGVHYFSDCIAGVIEGCVWVAVCSAGFPALAHPRTQ